MQEFDLEELPYSRDALDGISAQVVKWHHGTHQRGYVNGLNSYMETIQEMRETGDFSGIGPVKDGLTHNGSGMYLHELYWESMQGDGGKPTGKLKDRIDKDFGGFKTFKKEFKATTGATNGWAILVWWPRAGVLDIVKVDKHDNGALWEAVPILPIDTWEHAYYYDQGPSKAPYVEAVFDNLDWEVLDRRYRQAIN